MSETLAAGERLAPGSVDAGFGPAGDQGVAGRKGLSIESVPEALAAGDRLATGWGVPDAGSPATIGGGHPAVEIGVGRAPVGPATTPGSLEEAAVALPVAGSPRGGGGRGSPATGRRPYGFFPPGGPSRPCRSLGSPRAFLPPEAPVILAAVERQGREAVEGLAGRAGRHHPWGAECGRPAPTSGKKRRRSVGGSPWTKRNRRPTDISVGSAGFGGGGGNPFLILCRGPGASTSSSGPPSMPGPGVGPRTRPDRTGRRHRR